MTKKTDFKQTDIIYQNEVRLSYDTELIKLQLKNSDIVFCIFDNVNDDSYFISEKQYNEIYVTWYNNDLNFDLSFDEIKEYVINGTIDRLIKVEWVNECDYQKKTHLIEENYFGQNPEYKQPYLVIDFEDKRIFCECRENNIDGIPRSKYTGMALWIPISMPDATKMYNFIESYILPVVEKYEPFFFVSHDLYGRERGYFDGFDSSDIYDIFDEICINHLPMTQYGGLWDFYSYFEFSKPCINANMDIKEVYEYIHEIEKDTERDGIKIKKLDENMVKYWENLKSNTIIEVL